MVTSRLVINAEVDLILGGLACSLARVEEGHEGGSVLGGLCELVDDVVHVWDWVGV